VSSALTDENCSLDTKMSCDIKLQTKQYTHAHTLHALQMVITWLGGHQGNHLHLCIDLRLFGKLHI